MTLAEVYEALGKQDGGEALASTIKAEISKINAEAAKQRTAKNASDAKITEFEAKVQELTEKGTGDQTVVEKMQKQLDELTKKYDAAEKAHQTFSPKSWMTSGFPFFYLTRIKFITSTNTFTKSRKCHSAAHDGMAFFDAV